ncbi:septum formation initiator family protein [Corynebacterium sp. P6145]|uniref:septum formation initiator family protein n=1 Tax=Corynebacterium antarcticum TaxID=2800405 RepID=UPI002003A04C|nr:septum formation initiator family protein [Corynebacterium antarcticum]MCK7642853.1 septum formation initiator family protein [Corynebacterium antarcticum]
MVNQARMRRKRVPVTNRGTSGQRPGRSAVPSRARGNRGRFSALQVAILILVLILVLVMIAVPVRNYFQQRAEIARLSASIAERTERRDALVDEIEKYRSEAYIREQARQRLGVIEPGETPFRIIDPEITTSTATTGGGEDTAPTVSGPWWGVLWNSVADRDAGVSLPGTAPDPEPLDENAKGNLPTAVPAPPEEQLAPAPAD